MNYQFCRPSKLSDLTGLSLSTCKTYRLKSTWIEGIHWQKLGSKSVLYNLDLVMDWIANRTTPEKHQVAIDEYLKSLPSANVSKSKKNSNRGDAA